MSSTPSATEAEQGALDSARVLVSERSEDPPASPPQSRMTPPIPRLARHLRSRVRHAKADHLAPNVLVAAMVAFNLVELRSETRWVPLLNDGSVHAQMVRYATAKFESGHLPLHDWYPYLNLGSPQFLHYQSLAAMLTGLVGVAVGPDHAFNWSLYLLWSTWPISVYIAGRLFGWQRWPAAIAGFCATSLMSAPGVGFESSAYLWIGFGVWSQLFAMWTLPLAWAFSWRAVALRKPIWPAVLFLSLTICFHYITGYIAILAVPVWVLVRPSDLLQRLWRLILLGIATFCVSSWGLVPLMVYGKWASINEFLQHTPSADSYGARQVLDWLFDGQILDAGRLLPFLTILAGIGFIECARNARRDERARALLVIFCFSVVLFFGRPTLGPLLDLLPRSHDLFLRRFMFGVQLSSLFLAGVGATALGHMATVGLGRVHLGRLVERARTRLPPALLQGLLVLVVVAIAAPGWAQLHTYDRLDATDIAYQSQVDASAGTDIQLLVQAMSVLGPGRVYAGLPTNWGENFVVGDVPVFKYLSNLDLDVVGYTLRTASLMSDPESDFDETNLADYQIFGVRFLIIPSTRTPPVPAQYISQDGNYVLYEIPSVDGYFQLAETTAPTSENRADIGANNVAFLDSDAAARGLYPSVAYAGVPAAPPTDPSGSPTGNLGTIVSQSINLVNGQASAVVSAAKTAVVILKASYDPGWQVTVDGLPVSTVMIAPALVGVVVPAGTHVVAFRYVGYQHYPLLITIGGVSFIFCLFGRRWGRRLGRTRVGGQVQEHLRLARRILATRS